jgi:membrane-bound lytic murein transglycosylase D
MVRLRVLLLILALCIIQGCSFTREIPPPSSYPAGQEIMEPAGPSSEMSVIPPLFKKHKLAQEPFFQQKSFYDIDFEMNERIEWWVKQYSGPYRRQFINTLARFDSVRPEMEKIFESHGLPMDLVYLSMVESGGKANAVSRTGATGYWQFMADTGRHYNLKVNRWVDERRDLVKSTHAAARYLKNLHTIFDDWLLAGAAYNAGEGTINRLMKSNPDVSCFWDISHPMPIKTETLEYVPKFIATLILAKNRAQYGLEVPDDKKIVPYACDSVPVKGFVYLDEIAVMAGVTENHVSQLNPELIRRCTPPSAKEYTLKVPQGTAAVVSNQLKKSHSRQVEYTTHTIRKGDTLIGLGKKYSSSARDIARANRMKTNEILTLGKTLIIPSGNVQKEPPGRHCHVVAQGETLKSISRHYGVSTDDILEVNAIPNPSLIYPNMVLNIPPQSHGAPSHRLVQYRVKKGDTIWGISKRFEVSTNDVLKWNRLKPSAQIQPGDEITIYR